MDTITGLEEGTWCYLPVSCITNLFNGLRRRVTTARQEILEQSQDSTLQTSMESNQNSEMPSARHRPDCEVNQDTNHLIIPKASVSVITG